MLPLLVPLDLPVAQFGLMAAVRRRLAAIGEAMLIDDGTLVRIFTVLERRGLFETEGAPAGASPASSASSGRAGRRLPARAHAGLATLER